MQSSLERAMDYIRTKWQTGESLKEVASRFSIDPGNLARTFRNTHGVTIKHFVDGERAKVVRHLLRANHSTGYKIAKEIGMRDLTFYRWVRRVFGRSLTDLRRKRRTSL